MSRSFVNNNRDTKVKDGNGNTALNVVVAQGPGETIKVEFGESGELVNEYSELLSLAGLATSDLVLYTVPIGKELRLQRVDYSGENKAIFEISVNATVIAKKRSWFVSFDGDFIFNSYILNAGDQVKLVVENKTNSTADFNANLQGRLQDA